MFKKTRVGSGRVAKIALKTRFHPNTRPDPTRGRVGSDRVFENFENLISTCIGVLVCACLIMIDHTRQNIGPFVRWPPLLYCCKIDFSSGNSSAIRKPKLASALLRALHLVTRAALCGINFKTSSKCC